MLRQGSPNYGNNEYAAIFGLLPPWLQEFFFFIECH